jgi:septum formation protein
MTAAGFLFGVCVSDVDERLHVGETPRGYVSRLASEKSAAVLRMVEGPGQAGHAHGNEPAITEQREIVEQQPESGVTSGVRLSHRAVRTNGTTADVLIIGADTAVVVDDEILGKPLNRADAERMLRRLSGRAHRVLTGVSVRTAARELEAVEETLVFFRPLTDGDVAWYVDSGEGKDKAGGYAIQGLASRFIPRIEGSYSNVVGLPVARVEELIKALQ